MLGYGSAKVTVMPCGQMEDRRMFTDAGLDEISRRLDGIVQDKPEEGVFRARRDMFTDAELF